MRATGQWKRQGSFPSYRGQGCHPGKLLSETRAPRLREPFRDNIRNLVVFANGDESGRLTGEQGITDTNKLQTMLSQAVAAEDFEQAASIRDQLTKLSGSGVSSPVGWEGMGIPTWLADRTERLGFMLPTTMQQQTVKLMQLGADVFVSAQTGSGKTLAFLIPLLAMLDYQNSAMQMNLPGPQGVIIVPHRELGVQICLLAYRLLGGSINKGIPGERATLFTYFGPSGVNVRGIFDKEEVLWTKTAGYISDCHVVVATPDCIAEVLQPPNAITMMQHTKVVVVDEADECWSQHYEALATALDAACDQEDKPSFAFAGATIDEEFMRKVSLKGWPSYPTMVDFRGPGLVPSAIHHKFIVVPDGMAPASALAKTLRNVLEINGEDAPTPRALVFIEDTETAVQLATPLRATLWEEYRIGLVLPDGEQPTKVIQEFKECQTSMLLLTPELSRGLDLPGVSFVFNLDAPSTAHEYLHRTGRLGRIGALSQSVSVTLVKNDKVQSLLTIAEELNITLEKQEVDFFDGMIGGQSVEDGTVEVDEKRLEKSKKALDDLYNLY